MPTAKKLKSGSWRCQVYSHSEIMLDEHNRPVLDKNGKPVKKRFYESFTSDDTSIIGKHEAENAATEFSLNKERLKKKCNLTVYEAIDDYIESSDGVLSPTTIAGYRKIQRNSFQDIMNVPLKKLSIDLLQEEVNKECKRPSRKFKKNKDKAKTISAKTVSNAYGLITAVINHYYPKLDTSAVRLPSKEPHIKELIPPEILIDVFKGSSIELPVLLAMWLSFSMSEIRGLTKSKSLATKGYISVQEVLVDVNGKPTRKNKGKTFTRTRKHKIPPYIQSLIDEADPESDALVPLSGHAVYMRFKRRLDKNGLPHMTFHDLRHVNASVMALLHVPDKYALERGGWKTDKVMKQVYTHTFSDEREKVDEMIDNYFNQKIDTLTHPSDDESSTQSERPEKKALKVKKDFDFTRLLNIGYIFIPIEGGYLSPNATTIVYQNHPDHIGQVLQLVPGREKEHSENIKILDNLGYLESHL